MKIFIKTLNICPMRRVNATQYREALKMGGHKIVDTPEAADKILVWTCAVRQDFFDYSIDVLKRFEREGHAVIAAGCLPSIDPVLVAEQFHGKVIHFNNDEKEFREVFGIPLEKAPYPVAEAPITVPLDSYRALHPGVKVANDDQYIKLLISEGCTRRCSYCTEILAFPPHQSYDFKKIIAKAKELIERTGVKKIALFGDDIGAYGKDRNGSLIQLIDALTALDDNVQISLKQIHPLWWKHFFTDLRARIDDKKIFQLLVPIQSANTRVLSLMERGYSSQDLDFLFDSIDNHPEVELETHVIAGFPTETPREWEQTVAFILKHRFRYVMGNIYMPGKGTVAAALPGQIDNEEKVRRMLTGAEAMEKNGTVVGHNLSWRQKEHLTHAKVDLIEL